MRRIGGAGFIMLLGVFWSVNVAPAVGATEPQAAVAFAPSGTAAPLAEPPPPIQDAPPSELIVEPGANGASSSAEVEGLANAGQGSAPNSSESPLASSAAQAAPAEDEDEGIEYTGPLPVPFEGGYIQHRPHVFLIFWGSEWNGMPGYKEKLIGLYQAISGSAYAHILTQYFDYGGYFSGATDLTSVTDSRVTAPAPAYPAAIRAEVESMIATHPEWGQVSYENQYVVVTPPATASTFERGCGYHGWEGYSYTYVPWPKPECLRGGLQPWGAMQVSLSHEWAESTTDPIPIGEYWAWDAIQTQGEIADVCNTATAAEQTTITEGIYAAKLGDDYLWKANNTLCVGHDVEADRFEWATGGWSVPAPHSVSISGSINPAGEPAYYDFEFNGPGGTQDIPQRCGSPTEKHYCFGFAGEAFSAVPVGVTVTGLKGETAYSFRLDAMGKLTEGSPTIEYLGVNNIMPGGLVQFTTPSWKPIVSGVSATPGKLSATFQATIDGQGTATHYHFEYGTRPGQFTASIPVSDAGTGSTPTAVSQTVTEVEGPLYYRVVATNEEGTTVSPESYVYVQERPLAETSFADQIVGGHVTLHALVVPRHVATTYYFEYGPGQAAGGSRTPELSLPSQTIEGQEVSAELDGLQAGIGYEVRVVATNWAGTRYGPEIPFASGWTPQTVSQPWNRYQPEERNHTEALGEFTGDAASCASATYCMVLAHYFNVNLEKRMVGEEWNGREWEINFIPQPPEASGFLMQGVSCSSPAACVAVGTTNPVSGTYTALPAGDLWNGKEWVTSTPPMPAGSSGTGLYGVSCPSSTFCMAAGVSSTSSGYTGAAYTFNGSQWVSRSVPVPAGMGGAQLLKVSCTSASFCMAVGGAQASSNAPWRPVAARWNGSTWTSELPPMPSGANPPSELKGVSCTSATWCEAIGQYQGPQGTPVAFAEHWNGSAWSTEAVPVGEEMFDISCPAAGSCLAVGGPEAKDRLTSGGWKSEVRGYSPPAGQIQAVSCTASTTCVVAGRTRGFSQHEPGVETLSQAPLAKISWGMKNPLESSVEFVAYVNPDDSATKVHFEYGTTTSYGSVTPELNAGSGVHLVEELQKVSGLKPGTIYHFRLVVTDAGGTSYFKDQWFETAPTWPFPARLAALPTTDPFNGTTSAVSNFNEKWTALPWDGSSVPKGEVRSNGWGPRAVFPNVAGASYGPTVTDLGTGTAVEATMQANPEQTERYFSLWLDQPPSPTVKAGYQLKFYDTGTNRYTVSLVKWSGGTATTLRELTGIPFVNGNSLALVDEGAWVSCWINIGSGWLELKGAEDATYSSGTVAVEGSGNNTRLTNLRFGNPQPEASGMSAALGELRLDDAFATAESPLSEGGTWAPLSWDYNSPFNTGSVTAGSAGGWGPYTATGVNGAFWSKATFSDTGSGVGVAATMTSKPGAIERAFELLLDMKGPATERNGYELRFSENSVGYYNATLRKCVAGSCTVGNSASGISLPVGSRFALTDKAGEIKAWIAAPGAEYTQVLTMTDSTFTGGYVGLAAEGTNTKIATFRGGPLPPTPAADTTPPTVAMTAPAPGATVSGTTGLVATASDASGIAGVQFLVDGSPVGAEDTSSPYELSWNSASVGNGEHKISARAKDGAGNTATSAAVTVTVTNSSSSLALDGLVTTHQSTPGATISSPSLSTTGSGDLLLAFVSSDGPEGLAQSITGVTGGGLTWTLRKRANSQPGTAEVWQAVAPIPLTNATITATRNLEGYGGALTVAAFSGADTTVNGAVGSASAASGASSASLVTTKAGSWVWGVGTDWDQAVSRTPGAGQTVVDQFLASTGDTFWTQRQTATTAAAGTSVPINDTAPTGDRWNLALAEVRAAGP